MIEPDKYCGACGTMFPSHDPVRDRFVICPNSACVTKRGQRTARYYGPSPVVVLLLPVESSVVVVRRKDNPGNDKWCLPSGFMHIEPWRIAAARETQEEAHITFSSPETAVDIFAVESIPDNTQLLIFGVVKSATTMHFARFAPTDETSERRLLNLEDLERVRDEIAFPLHYEVMERYLKTLRRHWGRL